MFRVLVSNLALTCYTIKYSTHSSLCSNNMHTFFSQSHITRYVLLLQGASCRYFIFHLFILRPWRNGIAVILIDFGSFKCLFQSTNCILRWMIWLIHAHRENKRRISYTITPFNWSMILCLQSHGSPNLPCLLNLCHHCRGTTFTFFNEFVLHF